METLTKEHTSHVYEGELDNLHVLVLEMAGLVINQLENSLEAVKQRDPLIAEMIVQRDREVDLQENKIDNAVVTILAKRAPVANDLRKIISISKIVADLELIGDEIVKIGRMLNHLFDNGSSDPNQQLLRDIIKMGEMVCGMLKQVTHSFDTCDIESAYNLLNENWDYGEEYQAGIRRQLTFVIENPEDSQPFAEYLSNYEISGAVWRSLPEILNEYLIFMFEGKNIRHQEPV